MKLIELSKYKLLLRVSLKVHTVKGTQPLDLDWPPRIPSGLNRKVSPGPYLDKQACRPSQVCQRSAMLRASEEPSLFCMRHLPFAVFLKGHNRKPKDVVNILSSLEGRGTLSLRMRSPDQNCCMCS